MGRLTSLHLLTGLRTQNFCHGWLRCMETEVVRIIPFFGSRPPPSGTPRSKYAEFCDCAYFSHMAAPKPSTVTKISSQTCPILVTMDTVQPGLCHEGIENATVARRRSCRAHFLWQLTPERNIMMMMMMVVMMRMPMRMTMTMTMMMTMMMMMTATISKHPGRPEPRTTPHHTVK